MHQQPFALPNRKEALVALVSTVLHDSGGLDDLEACVSGPSPEKVMHHILTAATNMLLNNLCKTNNDKSVSKEKRKLQTLKS